MPKYDAAKTQARRWLLGRRLAPKARERDWVLRELRDRTMVSQQRLRHLYQLCSDPALPAGSLVECGVGPGGCTATMAYAGGAARSVWGFDSFEGMPPLSDEDEGDGTKWVGFRCSGRGLEEAQDTMARLRLRNATLVRGWFEQTLPQYTERLGTIAVLRLDNDWYQSTRYCLEQLYDRVAPGGAVIIDDYHSFIGCRKAVDEFRAERGIVAELITTDADSEAWWRKPG